MTLRNLLPAALAFVLAGCATSPVTLADSRPVAAQRLLAGYAVYAHPVRPGARVVVIRDAARVDRPEDVELSVDGRPVAKLQPGERVVLHVYAGERLFGVGPKPGFLGEPQLYRTFSFRPSRTYYYRVGIFGGRFDLRPAAEAK